MALAATATGPPAEATLKGYGAPFPEGADKERYLQGARAFPCLVPLFTDGGLHGSVRDVNANKEAWRQLEAFDKPLMTAFSDRDKVTAGGWKEFQRRVPGAKGVEHVTIEGAGHFLQEEKPDEIVAAIVAFVRSHPRPSV